MTADIIIIGGGLAGLTAGIHLARRGFSVVLFEKNKYPCHKVCGEFISNEILPYLNWLGADPYPLHPATITKAQFTLVSGKTIETVLPLGGFGISRYALDNFLMEKAKHSGVEIVQDSVTDIRFENHAFFVQTQNNGTFQSKITLAAFGKRSLLDIKLNRGFIKKKSSWLAVKAHYQGEFPDDLVSLHHFKGGYCGISKVENNFLNVCYLADYESFKKHKNLKTYQEKVLFQNPHLKRHLRNFTSTFGDPLTISQISFEQKEKVRDHILMLGDAAGLIHPLCGNGMAMAIHSAKTAAELVTGYFLSTIPSRKMLEEKYRQEWQAQFNGRLKTGRMLSSLLSNEKGADILFNSLLKMPFLLRKVIQKTHGKLITIDDKYKG